MPPEVRRYPVNHPLLKKYVRFFWEIHIEQAQLHHTLLPQRNINLRFNLSGTPQYVSLKGIEYLMEDVYFSGLQDHFGNAHLKLNGRVDMLGVCFFPEGFYPFLNIPVAEFRNRFLGAGEVGLKYAATITEQLRATPDVTGRIAILENELLLLLQNGNLIPNNFRMIFQELAEKQSLPLAQFCEQHNIGLRKLERMYHKYVGISASSYTTLSRFHSSLNQLLRHDYSRLSDVAFDNGYFDQMHFIREFKRFAGDTPKSFVHQNNSILQIGKLT